MKDRALSVFTLFTSSGTLLCCVLPAVVATIAGGAAVSSMLSAFPFLIPLSMHKEWIFALSGILIGLNGYLTFRKNNQVACDVESGEFGCTVTGKFNRRMFYLSSFIFFIGGFVSYLLSPILNVFS